MNQCLKVVSKQNRIKTIKQNILIIIDITDNIVLKLTLNSSPHKYLTISFCVLGYKCP